MADDRLEAAMAELVAALRDVVRAEVAAAQTAPDRLLSVVEAGQQLGIGRTMAYHEVQAGRLRSLKVGRRRLIPQSEVTRYIAALRDG